MFIIVFLIIGCARGYYGEKCTEACRGCVNGICNRENGRCEYGCKKGFVGNKCDSK